MNELKQALGRVGAWSTYLDEARAWLEIWKRDDIARRMSASWPGHPYNPAPLRYRKTGVAHVLGWVYVVYMDQKPSIGRVVHYYSHEAQAKPYAVFVTDVHSDTCINLAGFNNGNTAVSNTSVVFGDAPSPSPRWCWPPRV